MSPDSEHERYCVEADFAERVLANQRRLAGAPAPRYDFIVCGAGSSGSVVARRLAENPAVSVLLVEAGGDDDTADVVVPHRWLNNLGSERSWNFLAEPTAHVNHRCIEFPMGKVLGGGSSINVMIWSRGHRDDWNLFADQSGDKEWGYESVLNIYRRIEDWNGASDPHFRGVGGPVFVQPAPDPSPLVPATLDAARSVGTMTYPNPNGQLMEAAAGAAIVDVRLRNGQRQSVFRSYTYPLMDRPNLTVLTHALVTRVLFEADAAIGVEVIRNGTAYHIGATSEVVLSLGSIHTPKVLMQSGVGDQNELHRFGIPVVSHLPGVGRNLQDHVAFDCIWEYRNAEPPRNNMCETILFGDNISDSMHPGMFACQLEAPYATAVNAYHFGLPDAGWTLHGGITHPKSRGSVTLTGPKPTDPVKIQANALSHPDDMKTAIACIDWCREIGNAAPLEPYTKREIMPGNLRGKELIDYVRNAASTFFHQTGTAKMGRDEMSVVDPKLSVYGVDNLRVIDGSIMPRITVANTMAPCVVIGERGAELLKQRHQA